MAFRDDLDAHALRRKLDDDEVRLLSAFVHAEHARRQRVHATWLIGAIAAVVLVIAAWPGQARATSHHQIVDRDSDVEIVIQQQCIRRALKVYHQQMVDGASVRYDVTPDIERCIAPPR